ncbi:hypothetical protein Tco_1068703 [Tanacetum coccineum]|uniref:Reverse transcriptase domain-containing protein n=1 Tax=Tanacetum coccineum TaxID=301880 RepID=A0ABQ5HGG3_9ASTR
MDLHAVSRACHDPDGLVRFSKGSDDMSEYIVGISNPSNKESGTEITEGLVLDVELLDRVFKVPITTVKCISHGCRLAFSQALKTVLCKVVAQSDSIDAWVRLLLFPRCTLQVYRQKNRQERRSEIFWPSCNGMKLRDGLFPVDIRRLSSTVKFLGGAVSRDTDFISGLAIKRAANVVDLMGLLPQLHDPQSELLLLRSCMGIAKLFFGLRTCQPVHMEEAALFFDKGLRGSIKNIVVLQYHILRDSGICGMDDDYVSALACLRDTIPSFDFSGFTNKDTVPSIAQQTLVNVLFSDMVKDMEVHFDMTIRQKAVFECLRAPHAKDFLLAIPIDGLGQHMSPVEYRIILKYHLMISLFPVDAICRKACLDSFGEHAIHCKELPGFKYRHDMVRDVLFDICRCAGISAKKEARVNFLTDPSDGRSTLRPADVLVFGLSSRGFTAGQAALKATLGKVTKHEKACIENQHVFIPFAFDTFGFLASEAVELLSRVQRVMHSNVMTPRLTYVVFKRIGFAIQKGLAAHLVARLSFTTI